MDLLLGGRVAVLPLEGDCLGDLLPLAGDLGVPHDLFLDLPNDGVNPFCGLSRNLEPVLDLLIEGLVDTLALVFGRPSGIPH